MTLRTKDVAHLLKTSEANVHKMVQKGKLKAIREGKGKPVKFDTRSVAGEMARRQERRGGGKR
jgi:excisionase family DNA binding protein